jgi:hypothetical protein
MRDDRPRTGTCPQSGCDDDAVEFEGRYGPAPRQQLGPDGKERSMRHADGRNVDRGPQVEGEPGPSGMISAGGVHQEDVGHVGKRSNCRLEQRSLPHRERAGPIAGGRSADDSIEGDRRGPRRLARVVPAEPVGPTNHTPPIAIAAFDGVQASGDDAAR